MLRDRPLIQFANGGLNLNLTGAGFIIMCGRESCPIETTIGGYVEAMPHARRKLAAANASAYAPKPNGSMWTYGLVGASVLGASLLFVAVFYDIDLHGYVWAIALGLVLAFVLGMLFRRRRKRRHFEAVDAEHALLDAAQDGGQRLKAVGGGEP